MANMTVNQRMQMENAAWSGSREGIRRRAERGVAVYNVIGGLFAVALSWLMLTMLGDWYRWLVLAVIVLTTVGLMIAISPTRRSA